MNVINFGEPEWFTDERGNKIPIYQGLSMDECFKVRQHYAILKSNSANPRSKYKVGRNMEILDNCLYKFEVYEDRRVELISMRPYDGSDFDV